MILCERNTVSVHARRRPTEGGFGLLEVLVASAVLAIGLLAHAALTTVGHAHQRHVEEQRLALQAARSRVEELWSRDFRTLFAAFDEVTTNDPPDAPGPHFDVEGLSASPADPDGRVGRVLFPTEPIDADPVLREDLEIPELGLPFHLDGDGVIDGGAKDSTYVHLPVVIEIRWRGAAGDRTLRLPTWITPIR